MFDMHIPDVEVFKEIPGYKVILKAVLKCQIQALVEQLSKQTGEESVLVTACPDDGTLTHLGSEVGKDFLGAHDEFKSKFLGFCFKRQQVQQKPQVPISENVAVRRKGASARGKRPRLAPYSTTRPMNVERTADTNDQEAKFPQSQNMFEDLQFYQKDIKQEETDDDMHQKSAGDSSIGVVKTEPGVIGDQMALPFDTDHDDGNEIALQETVTLFHNASADGIQDRDLENTQVQCDGYRSHVDDVSYQPQIPSPHSLQQGKSLSNYLHEGFHPFDGQTTKLAMTTPTKSSYDCERTERPECPVCGKNFINTRNLRFHMLRHSDVRRYDCMYCWKRFSKKNVLDQHVLTHTGEKPYSCPTCGKCFTQRSTLYRHEKGHKAALAQTNRDVDNATEQNTNENAKFKDDTTSIKNILVKEENTD